MILLFAQRSLKASVDCKNKEIRREYLEDFVMRELARVIFNKETIDEIVHQYSAYSKNTDTEEFEKLETIRQNIGTVKLKITNLISIMATTGSRSLVKSLEELEKEQDDLEMELVKRQSKNSASSIDEDKIRKAYDIAKEQFLNGTLEERSLLVNQYVNKISIYKEHVEVFLNRLPVWLTKLTDTDFIYPSGQTGQKMRKNRAQTGPVVVEIGGGEGRSWGDMSA